MSAAETRPTDLLFAVLGVQLGYLSADDALALARELSQPGERRTMGAFVVERGILDRARAQVLERLAARAVTEGAGDAAQTLELLPARVRSLAAQAEELEAPREKPRADVVAEQPHRYFAAPRADAPPRELGRGDFARVVAMHDTVLGRDVAWKQPLVKSAEGDARLIAATRLISRLDHPAVVPAYELGRAANGGVYVTSRQVSSDTLAAALTRARTLRERLATLPALLTVARCVSRAHESQVAHHQLHCGQVSLGRFGEVYVLGWGQLDDAAPSLADYAADVRALGAMLHEIVTGLPVPVMGMVTVRGAPEDLLGLCRSALAGRVTTAEQFERELQAFIAGRRLGSFQYSPWLLLKRFVQKHLGLTLMAVAAVIILVVVASSAVARFGEERDRARLFARRFLDDVALRLRPQPGVEPLLEQVTNAALRHYERTTDLQSAPRDERLRVARAMARLGALSQSLGRGDEAVRSLDFADTLAASLVDEAPGDADARIVLAQVAAARAARPGLANSEVLKFAESALAFSSAALQSRPDALDARRAAAAALQLSAQHQPDAEKARADFDAAIALLDITSAEVSTVDELTRRQALGTALVERAVWHRVPSRAEAAALVSRLQGLREGALDDVELQLAAARAELAFAEATEGDDVDAQHEHARRAALLASEVANRRPDKAGAPALVVRAQLLADEPEAALESARLFERQGFTEVSELAAQAALFAGHFDDARTLAARPAQAAVPSQMLIRTLASAWLERPSDAVIQARALTPKFTSLAWPRARLAHALGRLAAGEGEGERAVRQFADTWRDGDGEAALRALVSTLETRL